MDSLLRFGSTSQKFLKTLLAFSINGMIEELLILDARWLRKYLNL